ncbi:MAG TPA: hypothetical protein VFD71_03310 [Planctomycetota bacterium]|nr:hypothetical protein [Planctomycetota bacterium]
MAEPITRVTLFIPGTPTSAKAWSSALRRHGLDLGQDTLRGDQLQSTVSAEWVENDGEFGDAFSFGTVSPEVVQTLDDVPGALVLHWPVDLRDGRTEIVGVVEGLREAGAIAVRLEQSKVGWDVSRWLELFSGDDPWGWHRGAVAFLGGEEGFQSCGMHAFSLPDVQVTLDDDTEALQAFASVLNVYQIAEDPLLVSGQTFSPDEDTPRRVVQRWPDTAYPPDEVCHNPYGVWRLGPRGGTAHPMPELAPVFIPALRVLLAAAEEEQNKPLTRPQVESIRDKGACMTMERRDAQKLERSRGYADLDPELVWEQWQLVRAPSP